MINFGVSHPQENPKDNRTSRGLSRRESGVQAFSPLAKTLAQGGIHFRRTNQIYRGTRAVRRTDWGDSKGGKPPLCRRGGGIHKGGTPSKGSLPYAPFWVLFRRGKSTPGYGGGAPENMKCYPCCAEVPWVFSTTSWYPPSTMEVADTRVSRALAWRSGMVVTPQLHMVDLTLYRLLATLSFRGPA